MKSEDASAAEGGEAVTLELEDASKLVGVRVGDLVWRTQHGALQRQLKGLLSDPTAGRALVDVALDGEIGEPLNVTVTDGRGRSASCVTEAVLQRATGTPLSEQSLRKAVGQLGGTPLVVRHVDVGGAVASGGAWLPLSAVKEARRNAVERLVETRSAQRVLARKLSPARRAAREREEARRRAAAGEAALRDGIGDGDGDGGGGGRSTRPHLSVLCRTREQVAAAAACAAVDEIVIDFLELDGIREGLAAARPKATVVAAPRRATVAHHTTARHRRLLQ